MRMSRRVPAAVVLGMAWSLFGLGTLACYLLGGSVGLEGALWLLGPFMVLFSSYLLWRERLISFGTTAHGARRAARAAVIVVATTRWRKGSLICIACSLLIGVAWMRSHWRLDVLTVPVNDTNCFSIRSRVGIVTVGWRTDSSPNAAVEMGWYTNDVEPYLAQTRIIRETFAQANRGPGNFKPFDPDRPFDLNSGVVTVQGRTMGGTFISFPHWVPVLLCCVPAIADLVVAYRRNRRGQENRCRRCDYDLTGNVSGRCPECGTPISNPPIQKREPANCV